jgi:hypothetical protein
MICNGCSCWGVSYHLTLRSQDGRIESANYCRMCYEFILMFGFAPSGPFTNLTVTLILASLDALVVCFTTARWIVGARGQAILVLGLIDGLAIAMLLVLQTVLLDRVRGKPRTRTVIATEKLESHPGRKSLWDRDLDG